MLIAALAILIGFVVLIWSADLFVAGAASIAGNLGMSPILIGLTIVSLGTSAPEVLVSLTAALSGSGSLAIGNAIGSNIANIALVLAITLLVSPLRVNARCLSREIPLLLITTLGVGLLILDRELSRMDGFIMLAAMALIIGQLIREQFSSDNEPDSQEEDELPHLPAGRAWLTFAIGLLLLIGSSRLLVWGAVATAQNLGVSELVIGLTIVAIGTSLPELAASVASAMRGHADMALGNIIGSNMFNLLGVMSIPGAVAAQSLAPEVINRDYLTMSLLTLALAAALFLGRQRHDATPPTAYLGRIAGTLFLSCYGLYYYLLTASL